MIINALKTIFQEKASRIEKHLTKTKVSVKHSQIMPYDILIVYCWIVCYTKKNETTIHTNFHSIEQSLWTTDGLFK